MSAFILCTFSSIFAQNGPSDSVWFDLFNGENLDGWDFKIRGQELNVDPNNTFRVSNEGYLQANYSNYTNFNGEPFGHIFYDSIFSYYILKVEYQFFGSQVSGGPGWAFENNGLMFHGQTAESMGLNQDFPISMEAQLLHDRTMNLCTPGTNFRNMSGSLVTSHCVNADGSQNLSNEWVTVYLMVMGDSVVHHVVEEDTVLSYQEPQMGGGNVSGNTVQVEDGKVLTEGTISLQAESHPTNFRLLSLLSLIGCTDDSASNYKDYYVKTDNSQCEYPVSIAPSQRLAQNILLHENLKTAQVSLAGIHSLKVLDVRGEAVFEEIGSGNHTYDFSNIRTPGVYFAHFWSESTSYQQQFIVMK